MNGYAIVWVRRWNVSNIVSIGENGAFKAIVCKRFNSTYPTKQIVSLGAILTTTKNPNPAGLGFFVFLFNGD